MNAIEILTRYKTRLTARLQAANARLHLQEQRTHRARCQIVGRFYLQVHTAAEIVERMRVADYPLSQRECHLMGISEDALHQRGTDDGK